MEKNPNSQATQGSLLSLRKRQSVRDDAGRRGQQMERTRIFALPREPSPSHSSSSFCSSLMPIKLPPVHLGQPKVRPKNHQSLRFPQVELGQPQAAPQGSRSQALSLCGDRLPPLAPVPRLPARPCLLSPRDTQSRGTELARAGEKGPQPCSPCPRQPHTPVPRVVLSPLRVAQEGTARVSPSWQLLPVPPIPAGAGAMECNRMGTVPEKRDSDSELSQGETGSESELSQVTEDVELFRGDSKSEQELSPVEDDSELFQVESRSEEQLSQVEEAIELTPGDSNTEQEVSEVEEDIKVTSGDSRSDQELSPVEEAIEVVSGDSPTDEELSSVEEDIEVIPADSRSDQELSPLDDTIEVISADSTIEEELSPVEEAIEALTGDNDTDPEVSQIEETIELSPGDSTSDQELSSVQEATVVISGDSPTDEGLSSLEEDIEVIPEDSRCDAELYSVEEDIEAGPEESRSDEKLSPVENANAVNALLCGDSKSDKGLKHEEELSQGDSYKDERLSPENVKHETELSLGEDHNIQDMSPWEADDNKQLSIWAEGEQEEVMRRALGGRDTDSISSPELPDLDEMSSHQKVLEWLEANFPAGFPASRKRPSRFRRALRALRGLLRSPCLRPRTEV